MSHDKEYIAILDECKDEMELETIEAKHFRRGLETIQDIIHNSVYKANNILSGKSQEDFERVYKTIIFHAACAIAYERGLLPGQNINLENSADTTTAMQKADEMIEESVAKITAGKPAATRFTDTVPNDNPRTRQTDQMLNELESLSKAPHLSKNQRRR